MTNRRMFSFGTVLLVIVMAWPLIAGQAPAGQAPPAGAQGQRGGGAERGGGAGGGQRAPAPPPTNLQVLPKDWTRQQVVQVMQQFNMGLGVTCEYCHIPMAGAQPGPNGQIPIDAAPDDKQTKKTARVMMKMVADINNTLGSQIGKPAAEVVRVQCVTCHRGSAIPKTQ